MGCSPLVFLLSRKLLQYPGKVNMPVQKRGFSSGLLLPALISARVFPARQLSALIARCVPIVSRRTICGMSFVTI